MTHRLPASAPLRWLCLLGGLILLLLGLALLIWPAAVASIFYTLLGLLLLAYGGERVVSGLRGPYPYLRRRKVTGGIISIVAGLVAVINPLAGMVLVPGVLVIIIGLAAAVNGVLQLSQFRLRDVTGQVHNHWGALALGVFKIGIGALILLNPVGSGLLLLRIMGAWALVGGMVLTVLGLQAQAKDL